jgi:hypothetical protein
MKVTITVSNKLTRAGHDHPARPSALMAVGKADASDVADEKTDSAAVEADDSGDVIAKNLSLE